MFQPTTLKRLSICPCGATVLWEDIPLGRVYHVDMDAQASATFICGGCRTEITIVCVLTKQPHGTGYLPIEIFEAVN